MLSDRVISGEVSQYKEPDWEPLRELIGMELADWFMWMFEIQLADGATVHAYKHITTRCYFHLARDGRAFVYLPGREYLEIDPRRAIDLVFDDWESVTHGSHDPVAVRAALGRARRAATRRVSHGNDT